MCHIVFAIIRVWLRFARPLRVRFHSSIADIPHALPQSIILLFSAKCVAQISTYPIRKIIRYHHVDRTAPHQHRTMRRKNVLTWTDFSRIIVKCFPHKTPLDITQQTLPGMYNVRLKCASDRMNTNNGPHLLRPNGRRLRVG